MTEPLPPTSPTAPKSRSGCLLALYIVLGIGAVLVVVTGIAIFLFARSERGQKLISGISEGISLVREASQAPGTDALRAAGCTQAMVMPTAKMIELVSEIAPQAREEVPELPGDGTLVLCQPASMDTGPDCAEVARIYAGAAPNAPEQFAVMVQAQRGGKTKCQGSYARDGSFLGPLEQK